MEDIEDDLEATDKEITEDTIEKEIIEVITEIEMIEVTTETIEGLIETKGDIIEIEVMIEIIIEIGVQVQITERTEMVVAGTDKN